MRVSALLVLLLIGAAAAKTPIFRANNRAEAVEGEYIVVFHPDSALTDRLDHMVKLGQSADAEFFLMHHYSIGNFYGYAAKISEAHLDVVRTLPAVQYIEESQIYRASKADACTTQTNAIWNLNRVSEHALNLDGNFRYTLGSGTGVNAYIIDTGIYTANVEFGGRAVWGTNVVDSSNTDGNGHGTHVAGTIGSTTYGFAKNATLIAVKVLGSDGSGTTAGVISGINWVNTQYTSNKKPSVANLSLGGSKSTALNTAMDNLVSAGVFAAVAAGNENQDACNTSPASASLVTTTGATTNKDARASFSNYGSCLDVFAPGQDIKSTWIGSTTATNTISGTSMASPAVAGVAAAILSANLSFTSAQLKAQLLSITNLNYVTSPGTNSPNKLLYLSC